LFAFVSVCVLCLQISPPPKQNITSSDMDLHIEKIPFNQKRGRKPSTIEYEISEKIGKELEEGDSVFISNFDGINSSGLRIRLRRINGKDFSIQKEEKEGVKGFRVYRVK
jgi:hypothetical protein